MKSTERIHVVNGYDKNSYTYVPVVIIGAGESGIAMACQLKAQLGFDQFRLYDRQSGFGGTWWINRYPGIACDVPTPFYSYSWRPNKEAKELYPSGRELIRYFQTVAAEYGIVDKVGLNTDVRELRWLEREKEWEITLWYMAKGTGDLSQQDRDRLIAEKGEMAVYIGKEKIRAKVAISAVGGLVEPRDWPSDVEGWDKFKGGLFHTARWKEDADLEGKDVIVVGTGCSAAQTVPRLTKEPYNAKSVTQIMRTAPWVCPKQEEPFGKEWYAKNAEWWYKTIPGLHWALRMSSATQGEMDWFKLFGGEEWNERERQKVETQMLKRMKRIVPAKYHDMLTPNFSIGCKRRIFDKEWYQGMNEPNIHLTTQKLVRVGEDSVTLAAGGEFPDRKDDPTGNTEVTVHADAIVLANGFDTTNWLHPLKVRGKGGRDLHEVWKQRGGAQAYMGAAMDGFPNFFIIFGPNTATGHTSVILATEGMVNYTVKFVRRILSGEVDTVEVKEHAELKWAQRLQRELKGKVFATGGCVSWYYEADSGWNSTVYSRSQIDFALRCMFPKWSDWTVELTSRGLWRQRVTRLVRVAGLVLAIVGVRRLRKAGISLAMLPSMLKMSVKMAALGLLESATNVVSAA